MPEPLNIDVAGAEAAMAAANVNPMEATGPTDPFTRTPAPEAPVDAPAPVADPAEQTPTADKPTEAPEADSFTHIDDAAILAGSVTPEMLLQLKKSLQADYTRKTQEVAPYRALAQEQGMSAEDLQNATLLYQRLQDPSNLPQFQQELSQYMQAHGMPVQQADLQSATLTAQIAPAEEVEYDDQDPAFAQVAQMLAQQQKQIEALTGVVTQSQQQAAQQAEWTATATRLTAEENQIRAANPHYTDAEIEDVYSLMGPDGNLVAAQMRYESMIGGRLARYLGEKGTAFPTTPTPAGALQPVPASETKLTPEQAHQAALRHVAELDALDAQ